MHLSIHLCLYMYACVCVPLPNASRNVDINTFLGIMTILLESLKAKIGMSKE